jgi:hypothetical protein
VQSGGGTETEDDKEAAAQDVAYALALAKDASLRMPPGACTAACVTCLVFCTLCVAVSC